MERKIVSKIKIKPLSTGTLKQSIKLLQKVFDYPEGRKQTKIWLTASLDPERYKKLYKKEKSKWVKYYVALYAGKVIGTSGLYQDETDKKDVFWLGWFCVDEKYRRRGIGSAIMDFTMKEEKRRKGRILKLWTTNHPEMTAGAKFYKKLGFRMVKKERIRNTKFSTLYMSHKI